MKIVKGGAGRYAGVQRPDGENRPADGELEIVIHSEVMKQFGEQIRQVVEETLRAMAVRQGLIIIEDKRRAGLRHLCAIAKRGAARRR